MTKYLFGDKILIHNKSKLKLFSLYCLAKIHSNTYLWKNLFNISHSSEIIGGDFKAHRSKKGSSENSVRGRILARKIGKKCYVFSHNYH